MIYSFHHYYHWLKGGVETGLACRAKLFRDHGLDAKFVFATAFPEHNIWDEMDRLGFIDTEILWMYGFFTDCKASSVIYTLKQLESTFGERDYVFSREGSRVTYKFPKENVYYTAFMTDESQEYVHRVVMISNGCLVRKDYYTYCRNYSEYYIPVNGQAVLYMRRFFNEDGSVAYEEMIDGSSVWYKFSDRVIYSREELAGYMMSCLHLQEEDVVLIDGEWGIIDRAAFIQHAFPARTGFIIHLNHFLESDEEHILWNSAYEYAFSHTDKIHFFVTNTDAQTNLLRQQLEYYKGVEKTVVTIPIAYLDKIRIPEKKRKKYALVTAGRLQADKRTDWMIKAAVMARKEIPDLTLDIYGEGKEESRLRELIDELNCNDYVHLCGFRKLDDVYQNYETYISASYGETFGITLLEAIGSGLSIIGFDVPYGMQVFVDEGKNGYRISTISVEGLAEGIVRLFKESDLEAFRIHSYEKAKNWMEDAVQKKWKEVLA